MKSSNNALTFIGTVASQVVFIAALLYYFGWMYVRSFFDYFGVDSSLVGYGTIDYLLRSVIVMFRPLLYLGFASFVLFNFHRLVMVPTLTRTACDSSSSPSKIFDSDASKKIAASDYILNRWRLGFSGVRRIINVLRLIASLFAAIALTRVLLSEHGVPLGHLTPLFLVLSSGIFCYIENLRLKYGDVLSATKTTSWQNPLSRSYFLTLLTFCLVAGLWTVGHYAEHVGTQSATEIATHLPVRSGIVVYSTQQIALHGPGVDVEPIDAPGIKYRYQYTGLRLLVRSANKFLLLPSGWRRGEKTFFLQDDNSVRIDVIPW